jgi:hypothetical protein
MMLSELVDRHNTFLRKKDTRATRTYSWCSWALSNEHLTHYDNLKLDFQKNGDQQNRQNYLLNNKEVSDSYIIKLNN